MFTPSVVILRKLKWIPIHNLVKLRTILLVVESLRGEGPTELRSLFKFACDSHDINTRVANTDIRIPKVGEGGDLGVLYCIRQVVRVHQKQYGT